jgi:heat shock protein HtpX
VLAHELSHVQNYDIRFMTLVAVLVGSISILANRFLRSRWLPRRNDRDSEISAPSL